MTQHNVVVLGRLARPHSIRGEIRVEYYADSPQLLDKPLFLRAGSLPPRPAELESWRLWRNTPIIRLRGVQDRTAAELLRGQELLLDQAHLPKADPDAPYLLDILGLPVLLADNSVLGTLENIAFPAGQEIWSIITPAGQEVLFPAVPEFVLDLDPESGLIRIAPPQGLLEIYLAG